MTRHTRTRAGFTLVELLVAIGLGIVLLGLAVAISQSSAFASYKVVGSADRVSQWMLTAKSRAARSKTPSGVRFLIDPSTGLCGEVAYIEQPEVWVPPLPTPTASARSRSIDAESPRLIVQRVVNQSPPGGPPLAPGVSVDSTRVFLINVTDTSPLQAGDLLCLPEIGQSYKILQLVNDPASVPDTNLQNPSPRLGSAQWPPLPTPAAAANVTWQMTAVTELILGPTSAGDLGSRFSAGYAKTDTTETTSPKTVAATYHTRNFGVVRQPRLLQGEPTQLLPSGMVVDFDAVPKLHPVFRAAPVFPATVGLYPTQFDVLFAPSGEVIGVADGVMAFPLRDSALTPPTVDLASAASLQQAGQIILVCVYPRTGAISTQPNNPPPAVLPVPPAAPYDPHLFVKDGLNTGL